MKFIVAFLVLTAFIAGIQAQKPPKYCSSQIKVLDGDTIILQNHKIRLLGIDAPEIGQKPFGENSKKYLKELIQNKKVCCKAGHKPFDKYNRLLAYCWAEDKFINAEILKAGQAISLFIGDQNNEYKLLFLQLEEEAQAQELGIYNSKAHLEEIPYFWRKYKKPKRGNK